MDYVIRALEKKDMAAFMELCQKHSVYEQVPYDPAGKQPWLEQAIFCDNPRLFCLVVEQQQQVEGYASYTFDFSTWDAAIFLYLDCLYLNPGIRGAGIGKALMEKIKQIATRKGCINIQWQTPIFNRQAVEFYTRIGGIGKDKYRFFIDLP